MPNEFRVEGRIQREQSESTLDGLKLMAYVFDKAGSLLGSSPLDEKGGYSVAVRLGQPADVELIVGPADMPQQIRNSSAYRKSFTAAAWKAEGTQFRLKYDTLLPLNIWWPWRPMRICVSGHVRKVTKGGLCPVPFVKVEVFDVDREFCFWPYLRKWWKVLLDRPVIRIPELIKEPLRPIPPFPGPDPVPHLNVGPIRELIGNIGTSGHAALNPQPLPPVQPCCGASETFSSLAADVAINPQPEPPGLSNFTRVGEARLMDSSIAARLDKLTLTSKIAPWLIFPRCFYSKAERCETTTDCHGYFNCCFNWWPFHFRRGRLRFDSRPDIIVKVTQIIDGVETVIYMDPYTSTRWNVTNAHIDLFLDNEEVVCSEGSCYNPQPGSTVFFTHIGDDEVYRINQSSGLYNNKNVPLSDVAYGGTLFVRGQFGDALTDGAHYYRLSYAKRGSDKFTYITTPLEDGRVAKGAILSGVGGETYPLGPKSVNGEFALYEVRNFNIYKWYNRDLIGIWYSQLAETDTDDYILRLEVFDENGIKLNSTSIDYLNGAGEGNGTPPDSLEPTKVDHCDLVITLDNKPPRVDIQIPAALNECGVIPWRSSLSLKFDIAISNANLLHSWGLYYTKGTDPTNHYLAGPLYFPAGIPAIDHPHFVSGDFSNLPSTCAFAFKLWAYAHVRDGRNFIYYDEQMKAIAIEKCS